MNDVTSYNKLKGQKDVLYDMIIGELNRISVTDDEHERQRLYGVLVKNSMEYYAVCIKCARLYNKIKAGDNK